MPCLVKDEAGTGCFLVGSGANGRVQRCCARAGGQADPWTRSCTWLHELYAPVAAIVRFGGGCGSRKFSRAI